METTLNDIKEQLITNRMKEDDNDEKTIDILGNIGRQFSDYFTYLKRSRLDELERQRELRNQAAATTPVTPIQTMTTPAEKVDLSGLGILSKLGILGGGVFGASVVAVLEKYKAFLSKETNFLGRFAQNFKLGFATLGKTVETQFKTTVTLATKDFSTLAGKLGAITKIIQTELTKPFLLIDDAIKSVSTSVRESKSRIVKIILSPFTFIANSVSDIVKSITAFNFGESKIVKSITAFGEKFPKLFALIRGTVGALSFAVQRLLTPLVVGFGAIRGFIQTEGNLFQKTLGAIAGAFSTFFTFIFVDIPAFLLDGLAGLMKLVGLESVGKFINEVTKTFRAGFEAIFDGVQLLIEDPKEAIDRVSTFVSNTFDSIIDSVLGFFERVKNTAKAAIKNPVGFFANMLLGERGEKNLGVEQQGANFRAARAGLDEKQQAIIDSDIQKLQRLQLDVQTGKITAEQLENIRSAMADMREQRGIPQMNLMSAPQTMINNSSSAIAQGAAPATASKTYE
jgi:hypothetical protein